MTALAVSRRDRIVVEHARHAWPRGYFQDLIGERIPFPEGGRAHGRPLAGVLLTAVEADDELELWFDDVREEEP